MFKTGGDATWARETWTLLKDLWNSKGEKHWAVATLHASMPNIKYCLVNEVPIVEDYGIVTLKSLNMQKEKK